jgi:hypothetical protein
VYRGYSLHCEIGSPSYQDPASSVLHHVVERAAGLDVDHYVINETKTGLFIDEQISVASSGETLK